jgi:AraC-like DNA-binding protein
VRLADAIRILDDGHADLGQVPGAARAAALLLVRSLDVPARLAFTVARGGLAPWQAQRIDRHLREHFMRPMRVGDMAQQISLSAGHFSRAFRVTFGSCPHAYLVRLRMGHAQRLMLTTGKPLAEIAIASGFADQAHFSRLFRRDIGETPSAWRRHSRGLVNARNGAA